MKILSFFKKGLKLLLLVVGCLLIPRMMKFSNLRLRFDEAVSDIIRFSFIIRDIAVDDDYFFEDHDMRIYIEKQNNQNKGNSNHNNHNHSQEQKQQTYTPEYGVRDVWVNCFDCHGTGQCSYCKGTGWYIYTNRHGEYIGSYKCTICLGSGRCTYCNGSGGHYEKQQYQIR